MKLDLSITGIGALTPVGLTGFETFHSVRSGVTRLEAQRFPDRVRKWIVGSRVPRWTREIREARLARLAAHAIRGALERAGVDVEDNATARSTALLFGLPEQVRPGYRFPVKRDRSSLLEAIGLPSIAAVEVTTGGSCSAQLSLVRAAQLLSSGEVERCVVGAVDSQLQLRTLRWHEGHRRLKCSYVTDGLIPGEAACFLVIERTESARRRNAPLLAHILALGVQPEAASILSSAPNTAAGLTQVVKTALTDAGVDPDGVGRIWSDLNGESYRAREWAFTEVRLAFTTKSELMHPSDCFGDLGAATDSTLLALAALSHSTGWSERKPTLVFAGSDAGLRSATVIGPAADAGRTLQVSIGVPHVLAEKFAVPKPRGSASPVCDPRQEQFDFLVREEHRDELASLYFQRKAMLHDHTVPWVRLQNVEQRMLNHLDAAVARGRESMAYLAAAVDEPDEGLAFAGAFLIGALPHWRNFERLATAFRDASKSSLDGIECALMHAPRSQNLELRLQEWINADHPAVQAMALRVAGHRRVNLGTAGSVLLKGREPVVLRAAATACGQNAIMSALPELRVLVSHADASVRGAALMAWLRLAPGHAVTFARQALADNHALGGVPAACLGILGRLEDVGVLTAHLERQPADTSAIRALGVLGCVTAVPRLLECLRADDEAVKAAAGEALTLISGLAERERTRLVAVDDGDDEIVDRATTSPEFWSSWWAGRGRQFRAAQRIRRGAAFSAEACVDELEDSGAAYADRMRAHLELLVAAGSDIPFEGDWFVPRQRRAIESWRTWVRQLQ